MTHEEIRAELSYLPAGKTVDALVGALASATEGRITSLHFASKAQADSARHRVQNWLRILKIPVEVESHNKNPIVVIYPL